MRFRSSGRRSGVFQKLFLIALLGTAVSTSFQHLGPKKGPESPPVVKKIRTAVIGRENTDINCYDEAHIGTVGSSDWAGCADMLIVSTAMLQSAGSSYHAESRVGTASLDIRPGDFLAPKGLTEIYTFKDDDRNIFTGQVEDMSHLFSRMETFNDDIGYWDTSSVTNMREMLAGASSFDQDIGSWETSALIDVVGLFYSAISFDQDISRWDTSSVAKMQGMFKAADSFNQPIGVWDTSSAVNMGSMFSVTSSFNQDLSEWDTSSVTNMTKMFKWAAAFDGDISTWNTNQVLSSFDFDFGTLSSWLPEHKPVFN